MCGGIDYVCTLCGTMYRYKHDCKGEEEDE